MASVNNNTSSSVAYSYLQSKNKIGGLVSGMDIDSIMEKLMKAESAQMEKLQQQKQKYEWKRDAYREVNTTLTTYQTKLFDDYGKYSNWVSKTTNASSSSALDVKASASASGNLSITQSQVATAGTSTTFSAQNTSQSQISATTKLNTIKTGTSTLNLEGKQILGTTLNSDATVQTVLDALNKDNKFKASVANGKLSISTVDKQAQLDDETKATLSSLGFDLTYGKVSDKMMNPTDATKTANTATKVADLGIGNTSFTIKVGNGDEQTINITDTNSISDVLSEIKAKTGLTASMSDGVISLTSSDKKEITIAGAPSIFGFKDSLATVSTARQYTSEGVGTLKSSNTVAELMGGADDETGVFTLRTMTETGDYKDTEITFNATDSISTLISKINGSAAGATAVFNNGKLSISANNTGKRTDGGESVSFVGMDTTSTEAANGQKLFEKLGVLSGAVDEGKEQAITSGGSNAQVTVNGVSYEQTSNTFNVAGYTINVKEDLAAGSKPVTVSSTTDTESIVDKVKSFVSSYNELIADLNTRTSEKKQVGYDALTDAQKAEMTTAEIEKWEKAAKSGLLKGDATLTTVISSMREKISQYGSTTSGKETLYSIGISSSKTWSDNGKLEIDEDKLRAALEKDPEIVARIFAGDASQGTKGLISELRTSAQNAVKNIEVSAGKSSSVESTYSLGRTIASLTTKIDDWKDRLKTIEDRYWDQFSAMETAIQNANSQSTIFSS